MSDARLASTVDQMLAAIQNARRFTESITFEIYQTDERTKLAVERCVEIVSEAARRLPLDIQRRYAQIPWDDIKGIGNILRHGYDRIVWDVIHKHLEPLEAVLALIASENDIDLQASGSGGGSGC